MILLIPTSWVARITGVTTVAQLFYLLNAGFPYELWSAIYFSELVQMFTFFLS
jgi:hypothetical protein